MVNIGKIKVNKWVFMECFLGIIVLILLGICRCDCVSGCVCLWYIFKKFLKVLIFNKGCLL